MTRPTAGSNGARRARCPRCGLPVLRHEDRLDWCLRYIAAGVDLRWALCHRSDAACPHPHVIDHQCTASAAPGRPAAPRNTRTP